MTQFASYSDVAVVITCHNHGRFLRESIESIRAQTQPASEIIVVDDGSTDDTAEIAQSSDDVRLISQPQRGLSNARNTGLRSATATFVVFLDADDRLLPVAIESGRQLMVGRPELAFVHGGYREINGDGQSLVEYVPPLVPDPYTGLLRGNYIAMHGTVMYRRHVLLESGGFDEHLAACEDYDVYLRLARQAPVARHTSLVAEYRIHGENMSRNAGLMLKTSVSVLKAQAVFLGNDAERHEAFRAGLRFWRQYYGSDLVTQVVRHLARGRVGSGFAGLSTLLSHGGAATPRISARAVYRMMLKHLVPRRIRQIAGRITGRDPAVGRVRMGQLRRLAPIDPDFGFGRGRPIDRYYIEGFLADWRRDIRGHVLEIGDREYTERFGTSVSQSDVLHVHAGNPMATWVADLASADHIPSDLFDCIILTQTLHLIYDVRAAVQTLHRILKPGGVVLATMPGITQVDSGEWGATWYWAFTPASAERVFSDTFGKENVNIGAHGNVLVSIGFLHGLAASELRQDELDHYDPSYPVTITVRATKSIQV